MESTEKSPFEIWFLEVKNLMMQGKHGFDATDVEAVEFEEDYWLGLFEQNLTPEQALIQDKNEE